MPGSATIIGRVAVKVVPDTDGFGAKVKAFLEKEERKADDITIGFDANIREAEREVKKAMMAGQAAAKDAITIRLDLDNQAEVKAGLKAIERELDQLRERTELTVALNKEELDAAHELLAERLDEVAHVKIHLDEGSPASIRKALSTIQRELDKMREQEIEVKLDKDSLEKQADALRSKLEEITNKVSIGFDAGSLKSTSRGIRALESELEKLQEKELTVELNEQSLKKAIGKLKAIEDAYIRAEIVADNDSFHALRRLIDNELSQIDVNPTISPATERKLKQELDDLLAKREGWRLELKGDLSDREKHRIERELSSIDAEISLRIGELSMRTTQGRLAWLARSRIATIRPEIDRYAAAKAAATLAALSGGRGLVDIGRDFGEWVGELDRSLPRLMTASNLLTNLSGYLLTATSNTLAFGGSLASIGGTALALPGIFGGMAIGVGATVAVMKDFNTVLPEVADRLHGLQDAMSSDFWNEAKAPVKEFIDTLFPQFQTGMRQTSQSLGTFFGNVADSAVGMFDGELQSMFDDLGTSILIAGNYTDNMLSVLQQLGSVGAGNLPRLAKWFGEITEDFDGWLKKKGPDGLQAFVDEGIVALKDLGGLLSATGSMFAGLARAAEAAGGSTVAIMRDTMEGVAKHVNSDYFQRELTQVFEAAHEGMSLVAERSGPQFRSFMERLGNTLEAVLPSAGRSLGTALGGIFDALDQAPVQSDVTALFENIEKVVSNLAPTLPGVARGLGAILETASNVGVNLSRGLAPLLDTLGPAIDHLADDLDPLINQLGSLLENAARGSAPVLKDLATVAGDLASSLAALLRPINGLADAFGSLPDPIQNATSSIASIGLLTAGAGWLGTGVRAKLGQFGAGVTKMGDSASKGQGALYRVGSATQAVTSRMSGLRIGLAGGAMALASLTADAAGADSALGNIASVGGNALAGFLVGGPWGAAIAGGATALLEMKQAGDGLEETIQGIQSAASSGQIEQLAAGLREINVELAASKERDLSGVLSNIGKDFGWLLSGNLTNRYQVLTDEARAASEANRELEQTLYQMGTAFGETMNRKDHMGRSMAADLQQLQSVARSAEPAMAALGYSWDQLVDMDSSALTRAIEEIRRWNVAADTTPGRAQAVGAAIAGLDNEMSRTAESASTLANRLSELFSPTLNLEDANIAWRESLRGLNEDLGTQSRKLMGTSAAADQNKSAINSRARALLDMLNAEAEAGASAQHLANRLSRGREALFQAGRAAGFSAGELRKYLRQIGLTPKMVKTIIKAAGVKEARDGVRKVKQDMDGLNRKRANPKVKVDTRVPRSEVDEVARGLRALHKQRATPQAKLIDKASEVALRVQKKITDLGKQKPTPTASLNDNATPRINDIRENLSALNGQTATVTTYHRSVYTSTRRGGGAVERTTPPIGRPSLERLLPGAERLVAKVSVKFNSDKALKDAISLANSVSWAMTRTMQTRSTKFDNVFKQILREANSSMDKAYRKRFGKRITGFNNQVKQMNKWLNSLREAKARLERLQDELRRFKEAVTDSFNATSDPSNQFGDRYEDILDGMYTAVGRAQRFATVIDDLIAAGLNDTTLQQLISAGPEQALEAAEAIANGGVRAINDAQAKIEKASAHVGNNAGDALFEDLIKAAGSRVEDLVKALKPLQAKLRKMAKNIAQDLHDALVKELKKVGKGDDKKGGKKGGKTKRPTTRRATIPQGGDVTDIDDNGGRTLIYNAAPGAQLTAEEQLFQASDRGRLTFP